MWEYAVFAYNEPKVRLENPCTDISMNTNGFQKLNCILQSYHYFGIVIFILFIGSTSAAKYSEYHYSEIVVAILSSWLSSSKPRVYTNILRSI